MAELSEQAKLRLVTLLARFSGPAEAARIVSKEFGVTLSRAQAWKYDPTRETCRISPKLKGVFFEVRERWLNRLTEIGVANKAHRLRALDRLCAKLEKEGDYNGALNALEQAAREVGGFFERRGSPGGPEPVATENGHGGHTQDIVSAREELEMRLQRMLAAMGHDPRCGISPLVGASAPAP